MATRAPDARQLELNPEERLPPRTPSDREDRLAAAGIQPPSRIANEWELRPPSHRTRPAWLAALLRHRLLKEDWLPARWR